MKPVIVGCRTTDFSQDQLAAFQEHQPLGMVVFAEPCRQGPDAVTHVIQQFLSVCPHGRIFMDNEGGAVNRLKPEFGHGWRDVPAARDFAALAQRNLSEATEAIYLNAQLIADDLVALGIHVNCAPVVDLVRDDVIAATHTEGKPHATSSSLYRRSYGDDPEIVTACAKAYADGLHSMGVCSVLKHAPGYGRVTTDPHYGVDRIHASLDDLLRSDLQPYMQLKNYPAVMTGHTIYDAIDPDHPATLSRIILRDVMRDAVGFTGVIIADTIEMNAIWPEGFSKTERCQFGMGLPLSGTIATITRRLLDAGCDVAMHSDCSRNFQDTLDMMEAAPVLDPAKAQRLLGKLTVTRTEASFGRAAALARLAVLLQK